MALSQFSIRARCVVGKLTDIEDDPAPYIDEAATGRIRKIDCDQTWRISYPYPLWPKGHLAMLVHQELPGYITQVRSGNQPIAAA
jgi:hypothetical protein